MSDSQELPIASTGEVVWSMSAVRVKWRGAPSLWLCTAGVDRTAPSAEIVSGPGPGRSGSGVSTSALKNPIISAMAGSAPGQACVG